MWGSQSSRSPTSTPQLHVGPRTAVTKAIRETLLILSVPPTQPRPKQCCAFRVTVVSLEAAASLPSSDLAHLWLSQEVLSLSTGHGEHQDAGGASRHPGLPRDRLPRPGEYF